MLLPKMTSVKELQKNYRKLFNMVKRTHEPLVVLRNNKPDVVVVDINTLNEIEGKIRRLEELETQEAIRIYEKEKKAGKLKKLKSLKDLMDES